MAEMLPSSFPGRRALILASGIFELLLAMLLLAWPKSRSLGMTIIAFLIAVFPANVYAAARRIPFGGHSAGPLYLLVRAPVQLLLILWTYWFVVRGEREAYRPWCPGTMVVVAAMSPSPGKPRPWGHGRYSFQASRQS